MTETVIEHGPATQLQADCQKHLAETPYFADVPVLYERVKDIENEISRALAPYEGQGGASGVCVIILTPRLKVLHPNIPGPCFEHVTIVARVLENVIVNQSDGGTKKPALAVALEVARHLHHYTRTGFYECINIEEVGMVADPEFLAYDVVGSTKIKLTPP